MAQQFCHTCNGSGRIDCYACSGSGQQTCSSCGGTGTKSAYDYDGTANGFTSCSSCGGSGQTTCFACNGLRWSTCTFCHGSGLLGEVFEPSYGGSAAGAEGYAASSGGGGCLHPLMIMALIGGVGWYLFGGTSEVSKKASVPPIQKSINKVSDDALYGGPTFRSAYAKWNRVSVREKTGGPEVAHLGCGQRVRIPPGHHGDRTPIVSDTGQFYYVTSAALPPKVTFICSE